MEVSPVEVRLAKESNLDDVRNKKFNLFDTLETVQNAMKTEFKISSDTDTRVWVKYTRNNTPRRPLDCLDMQQTVQSLYPYGNGKFQMIIIEVKNEDGTWPRDVGFRRMSQAASFTTASASAGGQSVNISPEALVEIREKLRMKKNEYLFFENNIAIVKRQLEELEREKKTLKMIENSWQEKSKKSTDEIKSLEDSLNEYVEVTKDLVTKLELDPWASNKNLIAFLTRTIDQKEAALVCPVCLETAAAPIFMCNKQHLICEGCKPNVTSCPECREVYQGAPRRHRYAERDAEELKKLQEELAKMTA